MNKEEVRKMVAVIMLILNLLLIGTGLLFVKNLLPFAMADLTIFIWMMELYQLRRTGFGRTLLVLFSVLLALYVFLLAVFEFHPYDAACQFEGFIIRADTMHGVAGAVRLEYWVCVVFTCVFLVASFVLSLIGTLKGHNYKADQNEPGRGLGRSPASQMFPEDSWGWKRANNTSAGHPSDHPADG